MNRLIKQYMDGTLKIKQDELTAVERYRLLAQGKKVDRLPCAVDSGETLAPLIGISVDHFYHSSEKMVEVEEYVYRTFHSDGMGLSTTLRGMAEAMGSEIRYFDNNISQLQKPALSSLEEAETAKKIDVDTDGRLHIILDGLKVLKEKYGNRDGTLHRGCYGGRHGKTADGNGAETREGQGANGDHRREQQPLY